MLGAREGLGSIACTVLMTVCERQNRGLPVRLCLVVTSPVVAQMGQGSV